MNATPVGLDEAGDHVEHGGLSGAVGAEQTDRLAAPDIKAYPPHNLAARIGFFDAVHRKIVARLGPMFAAAGCAPGLTRGRSRRPSLCVGPRDSHRSLPRLRGKAKEGAGGRIGRGPCVRRRFWSPHIEAFDETEQIDHKRLGDNGAGDCAKEIAPLRAAFNRASAGHVN